MRIQDCIQVGDKTILIFDDAIPVSGWHKLSIDGDSYKPIPVMDASTSCLAIDGLRDFAGKKVTFQ